MKVLKFGGYRNTERVRSVIDIVLTRFKVPVVVVVSAFQVTDQLIETATLASRGKQEYIQLLDDLTKRHRDAANALISKNRLAIALGAIGSRLQELEDVLHGVFLVQELSPRTLDFVMSFGELLSAFIISEAFKDRGSDAEFLDARKVIRTDSHFGSALVNFEITEKNIRNYFEANKSLPVITGFIGANDHEVTTTLGRGGSDYTAAIFGAALKVTEIEIWTDVDGVMTADHAK